jgi:succinate dehydrogenase/fumarate reductase flavoprotein subunit
VRKNKCGISRRSFLTKASVALSATAISTAHAISTAGQEDAGRWDREVDVVVAGAGAAGLPAAVAASEEGASVLLLDANSDVGGHAILTGGKIALGGGTSAQKEKGIVDSPDRVFADLTDWSVVEPNGFPDYRYNDREIIRSFAENCAPTYEWLLKHGVRVKSEEGQERRDEIASQSLNATGISIPREHLIVAMSWPLPQTGKSVDPETPSGVGLVRPLEASAKKLGVEILLEHKLNGLIRDDGSGRVVGATVSHQGATMRVRAKRGVVIATGGHSTNINFRRIFDPRLTEEYPVAGSPYSIQDASGELSALAIGASLWGTYNQTAEIGRNLVKPGRIGTLHGYKPLEWLPTSQWFGRVGATGLLVRDYQDVIMVNQAGRRFYDETKGEFTSVGYNLIKPYVPGNFCNAVDRHFAPDEYVDAAMAGTGEARNGGGPIWAIFDSTAVKREGWTVEPPYVDMKGGLFFSGETLKELAVNVVNKNQLAPLPAEELEKTVARYNSFVESGQDLDFNKPTPKYKINSAPFYAAWATPIVHDTRSGLRITAKCEVVDLEGRVIPGLYSAGESAGGFSMHGLTRCVTQGRIAGREVARVRA